MEVKDLIGKKTPSANKVAKKHGVSLSRINRQLAHGIKIEREHTKSDAEAREIALDHLDEIPDYYTRLKKMEREAKNESYTDPLEVMHNATRARILQGAKEGKYWLLRSEETMLSPDERRMLIDQIMETTTTASIGGYNKPLGVDSRDITMGGRNRWTDQELRFAISSLRNRKSLNAPRP
jgi:uncharacterized DUF497 family protein